MNKKKLPVVRTVLVVYLLLFFLICCNKGVNSGTPAPVPILTIGDASQARSTGISTMRFYININKTSTQTISADYTLVEGTAKIPADITAASGTVVIPANQTQATIDVQVKGNALDLRQANLQFTIQLSNPKFCTLGNASAKGTIVTEDGTYLPTDNTGYTTATTYPGYTLVWADEFSGSNLDLNVWNQEIGGSGWGNNELEYYTNSLKNTFLSNGNLIIEARKDSIGGKNYSSGRMTTQNKKSFKFGRIDIRAKLPVNKGLWPALWMLGANVPAVGWPACGEIDIMELIGTYPGRVTGTMHWSSLSGVDSLKGANYNLASGDFSEKFHVFSIVWTQDMIKWYVDDQLYLTNTLVDVGLANYPFNANQFFIFNVAVGGNWPGSPDANTSFPQRMFVDYVRVFQ